MKHRNVILVAAGIIVLLLAGITLVHLPQSLRILQLRSEKTLYGLRGLSSNQELGNIKETYPDIESLHVVTYGKITSDGYQLLARYPKDMDASAFEALINTIIDGGYIQYSAFNQSMTVQERTVKETQQFISIFDRGLHITINDIVGTFEQIWGDSYREFLIEYRFDKSNGNIYFVVPD